MLTSQVATASRLFQGTANRRVGTRGTSDLTRCLHLPACTSLKKSSTTSITEASHRQQLFFSNDDYILFLKNVRANIYPHCDILTWCLMPNHFHLMILANAASCKERRSFGGEKPMQTLPYRIGIVLSSYSRQINNRQNTVGSRFQQKTKAKPMTEEMQQANFTGTRGQYIINQMHYHHQNPYRAGLVKKLEDWRWSSFRDLAGLRAGSLCNKKLLMELTDCNPATFYEDTYAALGNQ